MRGDIRGVEGVVSGAGVRAARELRAFGVLGGLKAKFLAEETVYKRT
jgi:hypothetical protein